MRRLFITLAIGATAMSACADTSAPSSAHPAVIELFQSQGCSSCPPANAVLNSLADRKDLIVLSFAVTYWDYLGWKDSFALKAFTDRQYDYAHGLKGAHVATPQMVINGRGTLPGQTRASVDQALTQFARKGPEPEITAGAGKIAIGKMDYKGQATVWLVRYDPRSLEVPISAGENNGRTLPHRHIVKQLISLGNWSGQAADFNLPPAAQGLEGAILIQAGQGGPIVAAKAL